MPSTYEYAGFIFEVVDGRLTPQAGQHPAASKEKHRMAAQAEFDATAASGSRQTDRTSGRSNAGPI